MPSKCNTIVKTYNRPGAYSNFALMQSIENLEKKTKPNPTVDYVMAPAIYADITPIEVVTNIPYIETIKRATETNNINNINNNTLTNNIETILDRAERFTDDDVDAQRAIMDDIRHNLHKNKINELETTNTTKAIIQEKYFNDVVIKSDPQNVHETTVNNEMRKKYGIIKERNKTNHSTIILSHVYLSTSKYSDTDKTLILNVLKMSSMWNEELEHDIYNQIWKYVISQQNDNLIDSFFSAVLDCYENNDMVCTTGRVNRILGSLIFIDNDDELSRPVLTIDMLRKTILAKSYDILQKELQKKGDAFITEYNKDEVTEEVVSFKALVMDMVKTYLYTEYGKNFPEKTLNDIIIEVSYGI
jgi:hypothetical protein